MMFDDKKVSGVGCLGKRIRAVRLITFLRSGGLLRHILFPRFFFTSEFSERSSDILFKKSLLTVIFRYQIVCARVVCAKGMEVSALSQLGLSIGTRCCSPTTCLKP